MRSLRLIWIGPPSLRLATFAVKTSLALMLLVVVSAAAAFAQNRENTFGDSFTPLVYNVENTGANFPAPNFPSFGQLPITRPLPDPFHVRRRVARYLVYKLGAPA